MPVKVTMTPGFGTPGGTMRIMSARMLLKCAAAVKQNITARPSPSGGGPLPERGSAELPGQACEQCHGDQDDQRYHRTVRINDSPKNARVQSGVEPYDRNKRM